MSQPLREGEVSLTQMEELLWRNVHPDWVDDGVLSSQAFRPNSGDDGQMSVGRSSVVSASDHFSEYVAVPNKSGGIWALSVQEVDDQSLRVVDDSKADPPPLLTGHAYVDFRDVGGKQEKKRGAKLRDRAAERGCQHAAS